MLRQEASQAATKARPATAAAHWWRRWQSECALTTRQLVIYVIVVFHFFHFFVAIFILVVGSS
jgi:hypothetical protein